MAKKVHIGSEIKRIITEKGITPEFLAKQISSSRRNVYDILKRSEISTGQLNDIGHALNYDFFSLYSNPSKVEDTEGSYIRRRKVAITVELDGMQTTLDEWVTILNNVNRAL